MTAALRLRHLDEASPWNAAAQELVCMAATLEAPEVKTFTFETADKNWFRYLPGQFITLELPQAGPDVRRTYTLSSSPSRPFVLSVTVKAQPGSIGGRWMIDHLEPGMRLTAHGPAGRFTLHHHPASRYLFISAGSGVTPMMSMTRWLFDLDGRADIAFIHAARSPEDIIFRDETEWMARRMPAFRLAWIVESASGGWAGFRGRLSAGLLPEMVPDFAGREIFCCGPGPFMAGVRAMLAASGFDTRHYHEESFQAPADPPARSPVEPPLRPPGSDAPVLVFAQSGVEHACQPDHTVLAAARSIGINIPSACQSGLCGTCKIRCLEGRVDMRHDGGISDDEIAAGYILACCSRPLGRVAVEV
ncbi:MAG: 2Fe-2S iron-sulfur cluster-binding protein [Parvibaculaceae bacterium]